MSTFQKREEGFEKKFAHDEELRFKAMARRNKMLACGPRPSSASRAPRPTSTPSPSCSPTSRRPATTTCCAR